MRGRVLPTGIEQVKDQSWGSSHAPAPQFTSWSEEEMREVPELAGGRTQGAVSSLLGTAKLALEGLTNPQEAKAE